MNKFLLLSLWVCVAFGCNTRKEVQNEKTEKKSPNVLIVLTDQWRAQATGYAGDPNIATPHLDSLASISVNFKNAVSGMPVCSPFRASLITGQRPLTHGVFMNDVQLDTAAVTMGKIFSKAGYDTGYIGKWHLDGHGRLQFIPPGERRQGFDFWKGNECTHNYNHSVYYDNNDSIAKVWDGYDTFEQTDAAIDYMEGQKNSEKPFALVLSYGTPHAPYLTAPKEYRDRFDPADMQLRENVPTEMEEKVKEDLAGYYAHIAALDDMVGKLIVNLKDAGELENTIIVFTADHGDLLGSHGAYKKQQPYDESIRVPMLFHIPESLGAAPGVKEAILNSEDILPTLLGFCDIPIPDTVEGIDFGGYITENEELGSEALITCVQPFGQWNKVQHGGREYRGLRTLRYTYARDLNGPWLLFDNKNDPYQMNNLIGNPDFAELQENLEARLTEKLVKTGDEFLPGMAYIEKWGYPVDSTGTVPYTQ